MDTNAGETEIHLAQLAGEVQKTRADLLGEARGTAERLRAMEKTTGGLKPTIIIATVAVVIGVAIIALVLGQFLTGQMRAAVADVAASQAAPIASPADTASPSPAASTVPAPPAAAARNAAPGPHPVDRPYPAPRPGRHAPNTP